MTFRSFLAAAFLSAAIPAFATPQPRPQFGSQRDVSGTYACEGGAQGLFRLTDMFVTNAGFTATYSGPAGHSGGTITNGHISGVRR